MKKILLILFTFLFSTSLLAHSPPQFNSKDNCRKKLSMLKGISKLKVVTAKSIMQKPESDEFFHDIIGHERVHQDIPLNQLIRTVTFHKDPIIVTDSDGVNLGYITQPSLFKSVIEENNDV